MTTTLTPQELLQKIKNNEPLEGDYTVNLYGPFRKGGYSSDDHSEELEFSQQRKALEQLLRNKKCPENLTVNILVTNESGSYSHSSRTRTPIKPIFDTLAKGGCPKGLKINLDTSTLEKRTYLCYFEIESLRNALISGKCPEDLELDLGAIHTARYERADQSGLLKKGEVPYLIAALNTGKCPLGLKIKYQEQPTEFHREEDRKEFDKLEKSLKDNDRLHVATEIHTISKKIENELQQEIQHLFKRKGANDINQLSDKVQKRYKVLSDLKSTIQSITNDEITNINPTKRDEWKESYKTKLQTVIKASLKDENLDKYDSSQKFKIKLLNLVTALFSPIKYIATGSFFYSTEGKSKEAVQKTLEISESIVNKKP